MSEETHNHTWPKSTRLNQVNRQKFVDTVVADLMPEENAPNQMRDIGEKYGDSLYEHIDGEQHTNDDRNGDHAAQEPDPARNASPAGGLFRLQLLPAVTADAGGGRDHLATVGAVPDDVTRGRWSSGKRSATLTAESNAGLVGKSTGCTLHRQTPLISSASRYKRDLHTQRT